MPLYVIKIVSCLVTVTLRLTDIYSDLEEFEQPSLMVFTVKQEINNS